MNDDKSVIMTVLWKPTPAAFTQKRLSNLRNTLKRCRTLLRKA